MLERVQIGEYNAKHIIWNIGNRNALLLTKKNIQMNGNVLIESENKNACLATPTKLRPTDHRWS
jgi:hypothetical protein